MSLVRGGLVGLRGRLADTPAVAIFEVVAGLGLIVAVNLWFFPHDPGFLDVNPHPYWLIVIAIAARYGAAPGYTAGALAALTYTAFALWAGAPASWQDAVERLTPGMLVMPVLFILGGAALGELRESQRRAYRRLANRSDEIEADLLDVAPQYLAAIEANRELERRIVGQTSTVTTLYQAAKALEQLEVDELSLSVLALVHDYIDAEACALYLREGNRFKLKAARPQRVDFPRAAELDTTQGMAARVVAEKHTVTLRDVLADTTPAEIASRRLLMVTPLLGADRTVTGVLAVEKMSFLNFTPTAVKLFTLIGDWASSAFQRALQFQQTRDRNVEDEVTGAYSYAYMTKRLGEELYRASTYGVPLTLLAVRIDHFDAIPIVKLGAILRTLSLVFRHHIRPVDILSKYATDDIFLIALPHCDVVQAASLAAQLREEVQLYGFQPFDDDEVLTITIGVARASAEPPSAPDVAPDLLEQALLIEQALSALTAEEALRVARSGPPL